ncbi:hypothetical protein BD413DRAFT_306500 [Trametes elegans]|nr:hypothetical protein BD413DRAFT_306500 [Trametes elegans]
MGDSWIPELEQLSQSHALGSKHTDHVLPSPPERRRVSSPSRCMVSLALRALPATVGIEGGIYLDEESDNEAAGPSPLPVGFPVSPGHQAAAPAALRWLHRLPKISGGSWLRKTTAALHSLRAMRRRVAAPAPTVPQCVATLPGAPGHQSFEELRSEYYADTALTAGKPLQPVATQQAETASAQLSSALPEQPAVGLVQEKEKLHGKETSSVVMSEKSLSGDFTFAVPLVAHAS